MTALAAVLAGLALCLLLPSVRSLAGPAGGRLRVPRFVAVLPVGLLPVVLSGRALVVAAIAVLTVAGGIALWRRRRERLAAIGVAGRVVEACEQLAAELAAGRPPGPALTRLAEEWSLLGPVAEAFRMGADVPAAWRRVADSPGASSLRLVAAAWEVAHRTGQGLSLIHI